MPMCASQPVMTGTMTAPPFSVVWWDPKPPYFVYIVMFSPNPYFMQICAGEKWDLPARIAKHLVKNRTQKGEIRNDSKSKQCSAWKTLVVMMVHRFCTRHLGLIVQLPGKIKRVVMIVASGVAYHHFALPYRTGWREGFEKRWGLERCSCSCQGLEPDWLGSLCGRGATSSDWRFPLSSASPERWGHHFPSWISQPWLEDWRAIASYVDGIWGQRLCTIH